MKQKIIGFKHQSVHLNDTKTEQSYFPVFIIRLYSWHDLLAAVMLTALLADFHLVQSLLRSTNGHSPKKIATIPDMHASLNL